jgi:large subunit ribosomal protein L43
MLLFLRHTLPSFARSNPSIEITVSPRPNRHPLVRGYYMNGRSKDICLRNLEKEQILKKVEILQKANGERLKTMKKPVISQNESVRGIWSGLHGQEIHVGSEGKRVGR